MAAAAITLAAGTIPAAANSAGYNDFDTITSHVDTVVPTQLNITRPSRDCTINASAYYITGNSDPDQTLTMNGEEVGSRGKFGSFGVYVGLESGDNTFTFSQGGEEQTVTITRGSGGSVVATTTVLSSYGPGYDAAYRAGSDVTISATGPSGGSVSATLDGVTLELRQVAAAQNGVPARFTGTYTMPGASGLVNLGKISYDLYYNGKSTSYTSSGTVSVVGQDDILRVQVTDTSCSLFSTGNTSSSIVGVAKYGAVDEVVDENDTMYQLSMGGWITKSTTKPFAKEIASINEISSVTLEKGQNSERYTFHGTARPVVTASQSDTALTLRFHNTDDIADLPLKTSQIFSGASSSYDSGTTVLELEIGSGSTLWGYVVEYENNKTIVTCKYKPTLSGNASLPLQGVTVALDAGHGGNDPGALGICRTSGPTESSINYATTMAARKRLESLGATVLIAPTSSSYFDRMQPAQDAKVDLWISLHCNSTTENANGLKPNGIEIYYYEAIGQPFANTLLGNMLAQTGRANRGVKRTHFKVALNSYAPAVLVEMGFITNPIEFDDLCSKNGVFNMANAIGDAVVDFLA